MKTASPRIDLRRAAAAAVRRRALPRHWRATDEHARHFDIVECPARDRDRADDTGGVGERCVDHYQSERPKSPAIIVTRVTPDRGDEVARAGERERDRSGDRAWGRQRAGSHGDRQIARAAAGRRADDQPRLIGRRGPGHRRHRSSGVSRSVCAEVCAEVDAAADGRAVAQRRPVERYRSDRSRTG